MKLRIAIAIGLLMMGLTLNGVSAGERDLPVIRSIEIPDDLEGTIDNDIDPIPPDLGSDKHE